MSPASRRAGPSGCQLDGGTGSVVVGIPAYNEATSIGSVVLTAQQYAEEVVVVDDGSTDETGAVASEAGATVLSHERNRGKGCAIATVLAHVDAEAVDAVVLLDGDGQHRPADIPAVVEPVLAGDCDMVVGSRYLDSSADGTPRYRRIGQTVLDTLTNRLAGVSISDSQSGFRALSPAAITRLEITTDGMGVESEMVLSAVDNDLTVTEVPVEVRYTEHGEHSVHPLAHGLDVVALLARSIGARRPLLFFGIPGVALALAGGLAGLDATMTGQLSPGMYQWRLVLSAVAIVFGTALLARGLLRRHRDRMRQSLPGT